MPQLPNSVHPTPTLAFRITRELRERLDIVAAERGVSVGALVREGLAHVLDENRHEAA